MSEKPSIKKLFTELSGESLSEAVLKLATGLATCSCYTEDLTFTNMIRPVRAVSISDDPDLSSSPSTTPRGLILHITREMIDFDLTAKFNADCAQIGKYIRFNKELRAVDCVIDENNSSHRYNRKGRGAVPTYGQFEDRRPWVNILDGNPLEQLNVGLADVALQRILDPNTAMPICVDGTPSLIVARALRSKAEAILGMMPPERKFHIVSSRHLAYRLKDADASWFFGYPERAFIYMEAWPLTVTKVDMHEHCSSEDIVMALKFSESGQFVTLEPRLMVKSTGSVAAPSAEPNETWRDRKPML